MSTASVVSSCSTYDETAMLWSFSAISALGTRRAKYSASSRAVKASRIFCRFASVSLFLLPPRTNSAEASMKRIALSVFDFLSTMMHVAMVVPKNRSDGSWMTAST